MLNMKPYAKNLSGENVGSGMEKEKEKGRKERARVKLVTPLPQTGRGFTSFLKGSA